MKLMKPHQEIWLELVLDGGSPTLGTVFKAIEIKLKGSSEKLVRLAKCYCVVYKAKTEGIKALPLRWQGIIYRQLNGRKLQKRNFNLLVFSLYKGRSKLQAQLNKSDRALLKQLGEALPDLLDLYA